MTQAVNNQTESPRGRQPIASEFELGKIEFDLPVDSVPLELITPVPSGPTLRDQVAETSSLDIPGAEVAEYFSGGNSVHDEAQGLLEEYRARDSILQEVELAAIRDAIRKAGFSISQDDLITNQDPDKGLDWSISLTNLLNQPGADFFRETVKPLVNASVLISPLNKEIMYFDRQEFERYLPQLRYTVKITPRGFICALTQPENPYSYRPRATSLLRKQITGIARDEMGLPTNTDAEHIELPSGTLLLLPRERGKMTENGIDKILFQPASDHTTSLPREINIGNLESTRDTILLGEKSHYQDFARSASLLIGETAAMQGILPETAQHCANFCKWLGGEYLPLPDGSPAPEKLAYWLIAASVETRFPERVQLIMARLEAVFPEIWSAEAAARRFWALHAIDNGDQGHAEKLIGTIGAVFPPPRIAHNTSDQVAICMERLCAVQATAQYFQEIVNFDRFMLEYVTAEPPSSH